MFVVLFSDRLIIQLNEKVLALYFINNKSKKKLLLVSLFILQLNQLYGQADKNKNIKNMNNTLVSVKSGYWESAGKNPFWISINNNKVYWLGMNNQSDENTPGENWCHVGYGEINDNKITLSWSDIPVGKDKLKGAIVIEIIDATHMKVIEDSGNFGKSEWTWVSDSKKFSEFVNQ